METKEKLVTAKGVREGLFVLSFVVLIWAAAFFLVSHSDIGDIDGWPDLATLLFGASSVAIFILSFFVAVLAIFGWQTIQDNIRDRVASVTQEKIEHLANEMRGRIFSGLGYMVGEMSLDPKTLSSSDLERLSSAIELCRQGYAILKKVEGPVEYMGLNNLVFYSSLSEDEVEKVNLLDYARDLLAEAKKYGAVDLQLTACKVILERSEDEDEKREAVRLLGAIRQSEKVSMRGRREAEIYLKNAGVIIE